LADSALAVAVGAEGWSERGGGDGGVSRGGRGGVLRGERSVRGADITTTHPKITNILERRAL